MRIEQEKVLRLAAEEQLSLITNKQLKDMDLAAMALEEKERLLDLPAYIYFLTKYL